MARRRILLCFAALLACSGHTLAQTSSFEPSSRDAVSGCDWPPPDIWDRPITYENFFVTPCAAVAEITTALQTIPPLPAAELQIPAAEVFSPTTQQAESTLPAEIAQTIPYYDLFGNQFCYGKAGFQPYRLGWTSYDEVSYEAKAHASDVGGNFQDIAWNSSMRYSRLLLPNLAFAWTPAWNSQWWTGPTDVALPSDVDQISSDFKLFTFGSEGWDFELGFTPQIASDFRRSLISYAYRFDGRFVATYRTSAQLRWAVGAAFWDGVRFPLMPLGGLVWTPDDRWELRLMFPKSRISRYFGKVMGRDFWIYGSSEYLTASYQVDIADTRVKDQAEVDEIRCSLGFDVAGEGWAIFAEVGGVLDRHFYFRDSTPDFMLNDALTARIGFVY